MADEIIDKTEIELHFRDVPSGKRELHHRRTFDVHRGKTSLVVHDERRLEKRKVFALALAKVGVVERAVSDD